VGSVDVLLYVVEKRELLLVVLARYELADYLNDLKNEFHRRVFLARLLLVEKGGYFLHLAIQIAQAFN